jgi:DNA uptake protein ComE-like DNA-binding protein
VRSTAPIPAIAAAFLCLSLLTSVDAAQRSSRDTPPPTRPAASDLIDVNRASINELMKVPGMTRVWAERVIRFRPYRTKADLEDQGILPADLYSRIKDLIIAHRLRQ